MPAMLHRAMARHSTVGKRLSHTGHHDWQGYATLLASSVWIDLDSSSWRVKVPEMAKHANGKNNNIDSYTSKHRSSSPTRDYTPYTGSSTSFIWYSCFA